jgi:thiol-disulfide isomerase/thioredoxin
VTGRKPDGRPTRRGVAAMAAILALLVVPAGCAAGVPAGGPAADQEPPAQVPAPLLDCTGLAAPPRAAGAGAPPPSPPALPPVTLPSVTLPCVTGGAPVAFDGLRGPAVINLWASWCLPCRVELPMLQEFADDTGGAVHVVGVVTRDTHDAASWFADAAGVSFPSLYDRDGQVLDALPALGALPLGSLPVTLFVDGHGQVRHVHQFPELDAAALDRLAAEHLGITR